LQYSDPDQNRLKSLSNASRQMTSLLWQQRIDVAICLLLQTSLIGTLQLMSGLDRPMPKPISSAATHVIPPPESTRS
jgi:hypothetical protein|tara:strand:+ start:136 stop:366 length:231 start_codon:yes stop_codon:yes gene_type:complete